MTKKTSEEQKNRACAYLLENNCGTDLANLMWDSLTSEAQKELQDEIDEAEEYAKINYLAIYNTQYAMK